MYARMSAIPEPVAPSRAVAAVIYALPPLWLLMMFGLDLPEVVRILVGNWATVLPAAWAAGFAWRLSRLGHVGRRQRRSWLLIALALAADALGFALFGWYEGVLGIDPTYNWVNLPFYAYFLLMFVGLIGLTPPSRSAGERPLFALDVAAVGLAGAMLLAEFVVHPILDDDSVPHGLGQILTLSLYPLLGAVTLFGVASLMMRLPDGVERRPYLILCAAVALYLAADSAWSVLALLGDYDTGDIGDIGWLIGACLFLVGTEMAWRAMRDPGFVPGTYRPRELTRLLPYLATAAGAGVLLAAIVAEARDLVPVAILGVALSGTVFLRQWIAARTRQDQALADTRELAERRLAALVSRSSEAILLLGPDLRVSYVSPGATRLFAAGRPAPGAMLVDLLHPADQLRARAALEDVVRGGGDAAVEWRIARGEHDWLHCQSVSSNQLDDPAVQGVVVNLRDVSERVALEERLRHQSLHDPLTTVANRTLFIDRLMQALVRRRRHGGSIAVLFVDLDHFKLVNDSLGHLAGDHLLRLVGRRLVDAVRAVDTVARFGGDEFAILLEDAGNHNEVIGVAGRVLHAMSMPMSVDGRPTVLGASVGVAFAHDQDDADTLMRNADLAVYKAKSGGRGRVAVFEPDMQHAAGTRLELHQALRRALADEAFSLHYQPLLALADGALVGVEALLRWSRDGLPLAPVDIVAAAEEAGLIDALGRHVLVHALHDAARLAVELDAPDLLLTVNISLQQLEDPGFVGELAALLAASRWPAERLVLEFDERIGERRADVLRPVLMQLKDLGVRLSIDNLGIGEAALTTIERLPFDTMKISRRFVARLGAPDERAAQALTQALIGLGQALSLTMIGHGVEHQRQSQALMAMGCRYAQGFHLARPMPADELAAWWRAASA